MRIRSRGRLKFTGKISDQAFQEGSIQQQCERGFRTRSAIGPQHHATVLNGSAIPSTVGGGGRERGCRHGVRLTAARAASLVAGVVVPMPPWPWCPIPSETAPSPPEDVEPSVIIVGYQPRRLLRRLSDGRDVGSGGPQRNVVGRARASLRRWPEGNQPRMRAIRSELRRQKGAKPCPAPPARRPRPAVPPRLPRPQPSVHTAH